MIRMIRISKKYYLRQIVACWLVFYMFLGIPAQVARAVENPLADALPNGHSGSGYSIVPGAADLDIDAIDGSIINWNNFDIGSDMEVQFHQPGVTAAVLNKVTDGEITGIQGILGANGRVFIINPAGIVFGPDAVINVTQLVASSLNIEDEDFLDGLPYTFTGGLDAGDVTNEGSITAEVVALIAKNVFNKGHIVADDCAILAAGDTVYISENSPVSVEVTMGADWAPDDYSVYQVENVGGDGIEVGQSGEMATAQVILAAGDIWSAALVKASAGGYELEAVATIDIDAAGDVLVENKVIAEADSYYANETVATVTVNSGGDVDVISDGHEGKFEDYEASIQAISRGGMTKNTAEVKICADGYLTVLGEGWFDSKNDWPYVGIASIQAIAESGDCITAQNNTANVKIGAKEGIDVTAIGDSYTDASASITAKAQYAENTNTAAVVACTEGGVDVIAERGGNAEILAQALYGHTTDAYVGICAVDDVIVAAGIDQQGMGGTAMIKAEAAQYLAAQTVFVTLNSVDPPPPPPSANAEVSVVSHEGGVTVVDVGEVGETAKIVAEAYNAFSNTANVGVAAENVAVQALGPGSMAYILAYAHNGMENTADTVVCAPGEVTVTNIDGCIAKIAAVAVNGELNTATTQVYASDVTVSDDGIAFIGSIAGGDVIYVPESGDEGFCLTEDGKVAWTEGGATLIIDSYSNKKDCPDCPPCPCEEEDFFAPVAPLAQFEIPRIEGCPALTQAAALELGITGETLQVAIGNALALNPNIQPCQACATLVNAASILRDVDGSRMAAMIQVFNALAPADALFTPEMAASIATAFGTAEEGSLYASVAEYIDAFVQYAAVLDTDLGSPTGDSVAFVMEKYGEGVTGSDNGNIAAFVATRLEG